MTILKDTIQKDKTNTIFAYIYYHYIFELFILFN